MTAKISHFTKEVCFAWGVALGSPVQTTAPICLQHSKHCKRRWDQQLHGGSGLGRSLHKGLVTSLVIAGAFTGLSHCLPFGSVYAHPTQTRNQLDSASFCQEPGSESKAPIATGPFTATAQQRPFCQASTQPKAKKLLKCE